MNDTNAVDAAQHAYERYGAAANWKNYAGLPMPTWDELPENIRQYWFAAIEPLYIGANE